MTVKPRKYWENGTPLSRAFIDFYAFPSNKGDPDKRDYANLLKPAKRGEPKPDDPDFYAFKPMADFHREPLRNKFRNQFCSALLDQLRTGDLIATGKKTFPERKSDIEKIPLTQVPHVPSNSLDVDGVPKDGPICMDWDSDLFIGVTATYREVKISDPKLNPDGTEKRRAIPKSRNLDGTSGFDKPGRPTQRDLIRKAFVACDREGLINYRGTQQAAITATQKFIKASPDTFGNITIGYSRNAIARVIAAEFNKLKK